MISKFLVISVILLSLLKDNSEESSKEINLLLKFNIFISKSKNIIPSSSEFLELSYNSKRDFE